MLLWSSSPTESSLHIMAGVEKQANTSSVQVKWVRCGEMTACPRHWPHMYTWPLWDLAADVCDEWQAAISTILFPHKQKNSTYKINEAAVQAYHKH